jgi:hypothetical protein
MMVLVTKGLDVIAAKQATSIIPIVFAVAGHGRTKSEVKGRPVAVYKKAPLAAGLSNREFENAGIHLDPTCPNLQ